MSRWDEIKKGLGTLADKTANKTRELTDTASLKIKIASKEADRDAEYKILGKLTYAKLKQHKGSEAVTERISETIERLDKIHAELAALKKEEKERREAKEAEKAAREAAKDAERADAKAKAEEKARAEEELVMEQFNEARQKADEEYEKAKSQAEEAKNN